MFCGLVETLWCIAALLKKDSYGLWKIKCKQLLYIIFITSKTIKYAIVCIIKFHVRVNRQHKIGFKVGRIGRCGLDLCGSGYRRVVSNFGCMKRQRNYQQHKKQSDAYP